MSRKTAWKLKVSDTVSSRQDQALSSTTVSLLRACGPTAFLLRDVGHPRNMEVKVYLGDPHTCTCPVYTKEQEPCKHICWILLRMFRLPREHEYSFQHGLVERQVSELLHRTEFDPSAASGTRSRPVPGQKATSVFRKAIRDQDVCPICQEDLLEIKQPVSYCRFGCGNNVHISCMKVWASYQRPSFGWDMAKCPLCRQDFSSLKLLRKQVKNTANLFTAAEKEKADVHLGVVCHSCRSCPVTGRCFKCTVCSYFYLCEDCMTEGCHPQHRFASRATRGEKWLLVAEDVTAEPKGAACQPEHDSAAAAWTDPFPSNMLERLPAVSVRSRSLLLNEGLQCRICLQSFSLRQRVRTLPCLHKFHVDCVDQILLKSNSCPVDGCVVYSPSTWRTSARTTFPRSSPSLSSGCAKQQRKKQ